MMAALVLLLIFSNHAYIIQIRVTRRASWQTYTMSNEPTPTRRTGHGCSRQNPLWAVGFKGMNSATLPSLFTLPSLDSSIA